MWAGGNSHLVYGCELRSAPQIQRLHSHAGSGRYLYILVGATAQGTDGSELEEIAHSYRSPARIDIHKDPGEPDELHRGRVLLEGYDFALRAYVIRKQGEDRVNLTMTPGQPQKNPVFLINGWNSPTVQVKVNGQALPQERFVHQVAGHDLTIWIEGRFAESTTFEFVR